MLFAEGVMLFAVKLPAILVSFPTNNFLATPKPPLTTSDPEPILVASVVSFAVTMPSADKVPATSNTAVGLVFITPTCPAELILITVVVVPWLFNLKSISSSSVPN